MQTGSKSTVARRIAFSAVALALGMVTSAIKLFSMPMGGSVTLFSMLFITLVGYFYGPKYGLFSAFVYGLLQFLTNPYILSIPQVLVDYFFAFTALGLSGFFANRKHGLILGYLVSVFGRFIFCALSGFLFFAEYAEGSGMAALPYTIVYNGGYLGAEAVITLIILAIPTLRKAIEQVKTMALS